MVSSDVTWAITRNNSAYLLKLRGAPKAFSTDPLNLTNKNSMRYNGYLHKKAVGIQANKTGKGFVLSTKRSGKEYRPSEVVASSNMTAGPRASLHKVKNMINKQRYRKDLVKPALRRAALIARSQKPLPKRKGGARAAAAAKKTEK